MKHPFVTTRECPSTGDDYIKIARANMLQVAATAARKGFYDAAQKLKQAADNLKRAIKAGD